MSETSAGSTARHQAAVQAQAVDEAPRTKKKAGTKRAAKSAPHSPPTDWSALARQYAIEYKTGVAASIGASVSAVVGYGPPSSCVLGADRVAFRWVCWGFALVVLIPCRFCQDEDAGLQVFFHPSMRSRHLQKRGLCRLLQRYRPPRRRSQHQSSSTLSPPPSLPPVRMTHL